MVRSALAHGLRRIARWSIAVSNRLLPPTEEDVHQFVGEGMVRGAYAYGGSDTRLGWIDTAVRTDDPFTTRYHPPVDAAVYTAGPMGAAVAAGFDAATQTFKPATSAAVHLGAHLTPMRDPYKAAADKEEC